MMMEPGDPLFKMFHRYNKLVRRGLVQPLKCRTCATPFVTGINGDDELVLRCLACDTTTVPGITTIGNVRAVVKEHFSEDE